MLGFSVLVNSNETNDGYAKVRKEVGGKKRRRWRMKRQAFLAMCQPPAVC